MMINQRNVENEVNDIFPKRWSARAMSGETISDKELMSLFEAARWAPSGNNTQPWIFRYAKRESKCWDLYLSLLAEGNRVWAKNASVLIVIISKTISDYKNRPLKNPSFDTGLACENLALQGSDMGLVIHFMGGIDFDKTRKELNIPDDHEIQAIIAVGKPGKKEDLPENLQEREFPSDRKKVSEFVKEGLF